MGIDIEKLAELQHSPTIIRNICIMAHVDHGKTTLADSLITVNGIVSKRLAGKLRYMDYRTDEQQRGITMKSSNMSLYYTSKAFDKSYLINLIDTPGHVDFSYEVSTAVRLCEGTLVLVDAVEGVCSQTRVCLEQAYKEYLKPILVINKIDRLILEKKMAPLDAYLHLNQLLEQVNAVVGSIFASDIFAKENTDKSTNHASALEDTDDSILYFSPEKQNVIFASATDGWAFSVREFAKIYYDVLNIPVDELMKVLWGDYYFSPKKKAPLPDALAQAKKPMFVQFVLENIWNLYDIICVRKDKDKLPEIAKKLKINLTTRDLRSTDTKAQIRAVFTEWLPIHVAVLDAVIIIIPDPTALDTQRAEHLICPPNLDFNSLPKDVQEIRNYFTSCDPHNTNVIAFIAKMIAFDRNAIQKNISKPLTSEQIEARREIVKQKLLERTQLSAENTTSALEKLTTDEEKLDEQKEKDPEFVAFARIFSGTIKRGMKLFVLSPKHDPINSSLSTLNSPHIAEVTISALYIFLGGELQNVSEVPAGNIFGIGGLQGNVLKTATLSNNIYCPSFSELNITAKPVLKVSLEPVNILDMPALVHGLKLLNQADACVQVSIEESGEHTITTLGEVHLEKCIKDLEENYARIKIRVSVPMVSFRETIVPEATVDMVNETIIRTTDDSSEKIITIHTANKLGRIKMLALPLSNIAVSILESNSKILKFLTMASKTNPSTEKHAISLNNIKMSLAIELAKLKLESFVDKSNLIEKIWYMGSNKCRTNLLINLSSYKCESLWDMLSKDNSDIENHDMRKDYNNSFINGFQLAASAGPLCEEPMHGVAFVIIEWTVEEQIDLNSKVFGPFSGQVMSAVKEGCRLAFQAQPQRLVSPMYTCNLSVNTDVLGKMYSVIARRHGKIIKSDLTHGSDSFAITAVIPVIESLNFAQELRKQTSGLACPQLLFSHWEIIDIDPFWVPSTEEEYLHYGEKPDSVNRARQYIDAVRKRKGLILQNKIVEHAEKQRTLSKKK